MENDPSPSVRVSAELTVAERVTALQLARRNASLRLGPSRWIPLAIILAAVAFLLLGQNIASPWRHLFSGWVWLLVLIAVWCASMAIAMRLQRRLAADLPSRLELAADSEHLTLNTENASMRWPWSTVTSCEIVGDMLAISVRGLLTIAVPSRAFDSAEAIQTFADYVRTHLKSRGTAAAVVAPNDRLTSARAGEGSVSTLLRDFAHNIYAGLLLLCLRRKATRYLRVSSAQFALFVVLDVALSLLLAWLQSRGQGFLNWYALPNSFFLALTILAAASVAAWLAGRSERILAVAVAIVALILPASLIVQVTYWFVEPPISIWLWWAAVVWTSIASAVAAVRLLEVPALKAAYIAPTVLTTLMLPILFQDFSTQLWVPLKDRNAEESDYGARYQRVGSEAVLYAQPRLLDEALRAIEPGKPGVVELFYVGFAGSGYQDVFLNEVTGAERVLKERFALGPHSVILANSIRTPEERPFATRTALRRALEVVAQKMNGDEDILFLFLTAHGARNSELDVQMFPFRFKPLSAADVREMLDATGIKNRVIVVSACYAGGFITPNEGPDALIITAAHADRTSFGCRDGAEWTYFGQAFFSEALAQADSFEDGFRIASERVRDREQSEKLNASEPQMFIGERVKASLQALYQRVRRTTQ
jgi:hypothetical protein